MSHIGSAQIQKRSNPRAVQEAARKSLMGWLKHLSAFVLDCGLSISEVNSILRMAAVLTAKARQLEDSDRVNISGVAAITGIPRGEVSRILKSRGNPVTGSIERKQSVATKILSAWHRNPQFLTPGHRPRDLKIFGSGATFESLARAHGQGIPIRAILDELRRVGAVQLLTSSQRIRPRMSLMINPRITSKTIKDFDSTAKELFSRLPNFRDAIFAERVSGTRVPSGPIQAPAKFAKQSLKGRRNLRRNR